MQPVLHHRQVLHTDMYLLCCRSLSRQCRVRMESKGVQKQYCWKASLTPTLLPPIRLLAEPARYASLLQALLSKSPFLPENSINGRVAEWLKGRQDPIMQSRGSLHWATPYALLEKPFQMGWEKEPWCPKSAFCRISVLSCPQSLISNNRSPS